MQDCHIRSLSSWPFCRLCLLITLTILASCNRKNEYVQETGSVFHTHFRMTYKSPKAYSAEIREQLHTFSLSLNPFDSTSIVSAINRNLSMQTDSLFRVCFRRSIEISKLSGGAFDITCSPLVNAWGFGFERRDSINPQIIDSLLTFVGYERVHLDGELLVKNDPRTTLTFSSVAKGYSCDVVADLLRGKGTQDYMIEIGGEIAYKGLNPEGKKWHIGIDKPIDENDGIERGNFECIIALPEVGGGLATSGNYRNFYIKNGRKYAHTINPHSGYPVQTDVLSATVIAPDCMTADALATTFMVVGSAQAGRIAKELTGIEYMLVCGGEGLKTHTITSPGFDSMIVKNNPQK